MLYLVDYAIPGVSARVSAAEQINRSLNVPRVIDNYVYFPISKLGSLLHEGLKIFGIQHITRHRNCLPPRLVYVFGDLLCFACLAVSF